MIVISMAMVYQHMLRKQCHEWNSRAKTQTVLLITRRIQTSMEAIALQYTANDAF